MRLIEIHSGMWVNIGTGAITRISMEHTQGVLVPTMFLSDGSKLGFSQQTLAEVVKALKSHEYEGEVIEY